MLDVHRDQASEDGHQLRALVSRLPLRRHHLSTGRRVELGSADSMNPSVSALAAHSRALPIGRPPYP